MSRHHSGLSRIGSSTPMGILIVNPDMEIRQLVEKSIPGQRPVRISVALSDDLASGAEVPSPDVVVLNLTVNAWSDLRQLWRVCGRWPKTQIIFLSPLNDIHLWAEAIRLGAYDFLPRSIDPDQLKWVLQGAFAKGRVAGDETTGHRYRAVATN